MSVDLLYVLNKRKTSVEDWLQVKNITTMEELLEFQKSNRDYRLSEEFMNLAKKILYLDTKPTCDTIEESKEVPVVVKTPNIARTKYAKLQQKTSKVEPASETLSPEPDGSNNETNS